MTSDAAKTLMSFEHDGATARISVRCGEVVYEGDLPVATSARVLFDAWARLVKEFGLQEQMRDAGAPSVTPALH